MGRMDTKWGDAVLCLRERVFVWALIIVCSQATFFTVPSTADAQTLQINGKPLTEWLDHAYGLTPSREERDKARAVLKDNLPILSEALISGNDDLRFQVLSFLRVGMRPTPKEVLPAVWQLLQKNSHKGNPGKAKVDFIPVADIVMYQGGANAIPFFVEALSDSDPVMIRRGIFGLQSISWERNISLNPWKELILKNLTHKDQEVRFAAAFVYCRIDPKSTAPVPVLLEALDKNGSGIGELKRYQSEAKIIVPALIKTLDDSRWGIRGEAADALAAFGSTAKDALPKLRTLLSQSKGPYPKNVWGSRTDRELAHEKIEMAISLIKDAEQNAPK